jgi:phosphoadenosine phosphosulfate reductase
VDVVFLDTGLHFPQTLRVRDEVAATMPVRLLSIQPKQTVGQQDGEHGAAAVRARPGRLLRAAQGGAAGAGPGRLRRLGGRRAAGGDRGPGQRARGRLRGQPGKVKVAPLARWTDADVAAYIERYDIPVNELFQAGYGSIGCWPCTRKVRPGEDPRAGRWAMFDKTECGLHR